MDNINGYLKKDEVASLALRGVYESFGYKKYKMSKFEEYGLYLDNRKFLKSESVITFNDLNGKLLALKPDVTLSIVKNAAGGDSAERVYYIENVYRLAKYTKEYREIAQMGLEAIGAVDEYTVLEVLYLAEKSLAAIDENYVLDLSHLGFVTGFLDEFSPDEETRERLLACLAAKNAHDFKKLLAPKGNNRLVEGFASLISFDGEFFDGIALAASVAVNDEMKNAVEDLLKINEFFGNNGKIRLDVSIINDLGYYNGVVFRGYTEKIPSAVLSGGRYDKLMQKFGKKGGAIGFALYLDELEKYYPNKSKKTTQTVVLYNQNTEISRVFGTAKALTDEGESVLCLTSLPQDLRYGRLVDLTKEDK